MKALAGEIGAALAFVAIGVVVSLIAVLAQGVKASPDEPRISWIYRGMVPFNEQQCSPYEGDPDWGQYHISGWHTCWHLTEPGYPAIDYTRTEGQTAGSGVWVDYDGDFELFKMLEYVGNCKGVRAALYWESYDEANYRGDIHYLHIDVNDWVIDEELTSQVLYIGDVAEEDNPGCLGWVEIEPGVWYWPPHLHQSADANMSYPFCSNKFVNPSDGQNWQHKIYWLDDYTNDTDCDGFKDDVEDYLGTDQLEDCPDAVGSHDAWPLDMNMDRLINLTGDVAKYSGKIGCNVSSPDCRRLDLNADGAVNLTGDAVLYVGKIGMYCLP
jgi:hypothetical protein